MPRFFVTKDQIADGRITLDGENARHISLVLRCKEGQAVTVCDGAGTDYNCTIAGLAPESVSLLVQSTSPTASEPKISVQLFVALQKGDKFEYMLEKAVELGVTGITPFVSARCVSTPDAKQLQKKVERWNKIVAAASKQSGRGIIPAVAPVCTFKDAVQQATGGYLPLFLYEGEENYTLKQALLQPCEAIAIMVGPEGGFSAEEARHAEKSGMIKTTLGKRILRCETAPLFALGAIAFHNDL